MSITYNFAGQVALSTGADISEDVLQRGVDGMTVDGGFTAQ
ncbi:hypothetical protein ACEK06_20155 [Pseudomonas brenneri]